MQSFTFIREITPQLCTQQTHINTDYQLDIDMTASKQSKNALPIRQLLIKNININKITNRK